VVMDSLEEADVVVGIGMPWANPAELGLELSIRVEKESSK
jgi:hypothetical protein